MGAVRPELDVGVALSHRAIDEALSAVASEEVSRKILAKALAAAGELLLPDERPALSEFAEVHLRDAIASVLGDDAAEAVHADLSRIIGLPEYEQTGVHSISDDALFESSSRALAVGAGSPWPSATRSTTTCNSPTRYPSARSNPAVIIATRNERRLIEMVRLLTDFDTVQRAEDAVTLLHAVQSDRPSIVVLDCKNPAVQPTTLAIVESELPEETRVILWGATPDIEATLGTLIVETSHWIPCAPETAIEDVVSLIRSVALRSP